MLRAGSKYYFTKLTDGEKNLYNHITDALDRFDPALSIHAGMGKPFTVDIKKILKYVLLDNPGFFYINKDFVIKQTPMYIQIYFQYEYTQTEAERLSLNRIKISTPRSLSSIIRKLYAMALIMSLSRKVSRIELTARNN